MKQGAAKATKTVNERISDNIRDIRKQKGLTQERLAELSGVSAQHISKIERGAASPSVSTLIKLAEPLDVDPKRFFD